MNPNYRPESTSSHASSSSSQPYQGLRTLAGVIRVLGFLAWGGGLLQAFSAAAQASDHWDDPVMPFLLWVGISFTVGLFNLLTASLIQLALDAKADLEQLVTKVGALTPNPKPMEAVPATEEGAPPASSQE